MKSNFGVITWVTWKRHVSKTDFRAPSTGAGGLHLSHFASEHVGSIHSRFSTSCESAIVSHYSFFMQLLSTIYRTLTALSFSESFSSPPPPLCHSGQSTAWNSAVTPCDDFERGGRWWEPSWQRWVWCPSQFQCQLCLCAQISTVQSTFLVDCSFRIYHLHASKMKRSNHEGHVPFRHKEKENKGRDALTWFPPPGTIKKTLLT